MTDTELLARLDNLYSMLEEEGYYTKANTAAAAAARIRELNTDIQLLMGKINDEITRREQVEMGKQNG